MSMKLWRCNDGKLIIRDGKLIRCDECPKIEHKICTFSYHVKYKFTILEEWYDPSSFWGFSFYCRLHPDDFACLDKKGIDPILDSTTTYNIELEDATRTMEEETFIDYGFTTKHDFVIHNILYYLHEFRYPYIFYATISGSMKLKYWGPSKIDKTTITRNIQSLSLPATVEELEFIYSITDCHTIESEFE